MSFSLSENLKTFRRWRRGIWRRVGKKLLDAPPPDSVGLPERLKRHDAKALFLFNAGKIGDCVCSTFVFRELKKVYPNLEIHVLCSRNVTPLFDRCRSVDRIWRMKHSYRLFEFIAKGLRMRRERFALVVARDGGVRTRELLFFRLLGAEEYIGHFVGLSQTAEPPTSTIGKTGIPEFLTKDYELSDLKIFSRTVSTGRRNMREIKGDILRFAGIESFSDEYECPRDPEAEAQIDEFLAREKISAGKFIALNLFGNGNNRKINEANAIALVENLCGKYANQGWTCILLGSPKDDDKVADVLKSWEQNTRGNSAKRQFLTAYRPTTSIFQNIALTAKSGLLISPDTSIVHIGDAFKIPMIAFFTPPERLAEIGMPTWKPHDRPSTRLFFYDRDVNEIDFSNLPL